MENSAGLILVDGSNLLDWAVSKNIGCSFSVPPDATGTPISQRWYAGTLEVNIATSAWTLRLIDTYTSIMWINSTESGIWKGWKPLATATKPQEYALPLAAGMTERGPCRYSKDQFGRVLVKISLDFPPTTDSGTPFLIATLPEGYKPSSYTSAALIGVSALGYREPAALDVIPDGNMVVYADASLGIVVGEVLFEAA